MNYTEENNAKVLFYSCMSMHHDSHNIWYLDSGCNNHMTGYKKYFVKIDEQISSQVKMGNGAMQFVEGKGVVAVKTKGRSTCVY